MPKLISLRKGGFSLLLWSVIPAAFIGPGTVTTCSKAGAGYGLSLLWALTFSTFATIILQEAAARITIASGKTLGEIIALKYQKQNARWLKRILFAAVVFGCAAYQAGNILGAVSGLTLLFNVPQTVLTGGLGLVAAALLWSGSLRVITHVMAVIVFFMGIAFVNVALKTPAQPAEVMAAIVTPSFPPGSELLIIGLVGTTVVPYNLFLASGLSKGQGTNEMRWGLGLAVVIGGLISMAILLTGMQIQGNFSFQSLSETLSGNLGPWAKGLFGLGLFAAGASSSITAPLAAAITGQAVFGEKGSSWTTKSVPFRLVWAVVLFTGLAFGISGVKPIPAIIAAQAINGLLLPGIAIFLMLAVNDRKLLTEKYVNKTGWNILTGLVVVVVTMLGIYNVWKALSG